MRSVTPAAPPNHACPGAIPSKAAAPAITASIRTVESTSFFDICERSILTNGDWRYYATHEYSYPDRKAHARHSRWEQAQTDRRIRRPSEFINFGIEHRENAEPGRLAGAGSNAGIRRIYGGCARHAE